MRYRSYFLGMFFLAVMSSPEQGVSFTPGYDCSRLLSSESRALCLRGGGVGGDGVNYGTPSSNSTDSRRSRIYSNLPSCGPQSGRWRHMCFGEYFGSGFVYRGEFRNHKFDRQGVIEYASGELYEGQFREDTYDGYGVYYGKNGEILGRGVWRRNTFVGSTNSGIAPNTTPRTPVSQPPVAQVSTQSPEQTRNSLTLSVSASIPDSNGVVTLQIATNVDIASL